MLSYLKFELNRLRRDPRLVVLTLLLPVLIFMINSGNKGTLDNVQVSTYLMVSMATYGALVGVLSVGVSVSQERASGWLRQLRITPLSPAKVVATKVLVGSLLAIPSVIAVGVTAVATKGVDFRAWQWIALVGLLWIGSLPFAALGLALGFSMPPTLTQPVSMLGVFGLSFLGGLFLPVAIMPKLLGQIAVWLPSNRYGELGWAVAAGHAPTVKGVAILAGWAVVFALLAALAYRRSAATR
jgi:ABC-2 type transport system permease protein